MKKLYRNLQTGSCVGYGIVSYLKRYQLFSINCINKSIQYMKEWSEESRFIVKNVDTQNILLVKSDCTMFYIINIIQPVNLQEFSVTVI